MLCCVVDLFCRLFSSQHKTPPQDKSSTRQVVHKTSRPQDINNTKDKMEAILGFPFRFLRAPQVEIKLQTQLFQPKAMTVFAIVFLSYYLVSAGLIYDVITETPSMGSYQDPRTGAVRPVAIMAGRLNSQYIIEGLTGSFLFCLGGAGLILLDYSQGFDAQSKLKGIFTGVGVIMATAAYFLCVSFIRLKVPNYLH